LYFLVETVAAIRAVHNMYAVAAKAESPSSPGKKKVLSVVDEIEE